MLSPLTIALASLVVSVSLIQDHVLLSAIERYWTAELAVNLPANVQNDVDRLLVTLQNELRLTAASSGSVPTFPRLTTPLTNPSPIVRPSASNNRDEDEDEDEEEAFTLAGKRAAHHSRDEGPARKKKRDGSSTQT